MPKKDVIQILKSVNAILTDSHFIFTTGKHSSVYVNKDMLYPHTAKTAQVCKMMAERMQKYNVHAVVSPTLGGIILSQWTAYYLSKLKGKEILSLYAEKMPDKTFAFTRGYDQLVKKKRVLVVEDITTTGYSAKKVVEAVQAGGGKVVAVCVMVNRDPEHVTSKTFGVPFFALGEFAAAAYDEAEVPDWLRKIPVNTSVGHGKDYLAARKKHR